MKFKIDNEHLKNITKINKYNKLNMTGHKADINITKSYCELQKNGLTVTKLHHRYFPCKFLRFL